MTAIFYGKLWLYNIIVFTKGRGMGRKPATHTPTLNKYPYQNHGISKQRRVTNIKNLIVGIMKINNDL